MPDEKMLRIDMVHKGRIDFYIPIKIETKLSFTKLSKKISNFLDMDINKHTSEIEEDFRKLSKELNDIETAFAEDTPKKRTSKEQDREKTFQKKHISRDNDGSELRLDITNTGVQIEMKPGERIAQVDRLNILSTEYEQSKRIYGPVFTVSQERFVLLPLHVRLYNGNYVWLNAILYVFKNMTGILKLELPLVNVSTTPMIDYKFNDYVKEIINKWELEFFDRLTTIEDIAMAYINRISAKCKMKLILQSGIVKNIILAEYSGMPERIEKLPIEIKEDLYRIIAAPIEGFGCTNYKNDARNYIENQTWGKHYFKYITSTTGGVLSITDKTTIKLMQDLYMEKHDLSDLNEHDKDLINESIVHNICINVEFAIVIILLKRMSNSYTYSLKLTRSEELHEIQRIYNQDIMFISELQENCFGTVSEQVAEFEHMMPYYLNCDITKEKMEAIDHILLDEQSQKHRTLQDFLSFGSLVMTIVFGLPAIYDTSSLIRSFCSFINNDIRYLSIIGISVSVWLFLIATLTIYILKKK